MSLSPGERSRMESEVSLFVDRVLYLWTLRDPDVIEEFRRVIHPGLSAVGTGRDEIVRSNAEDMLRFLGREVAQLPRGVDMHVLSRTIDVIAPGTANALVELEITPVVEPAIPSIYGRMSLNVHRAEGGPWLVTHWHVSVPIAEQVEGEAWPIDALRARTQELERQVAERTAEIVRASRLNLALERIRAQAMAMQESSDLLDIVVTMRSEFTALGHEAHYFWHMRWLETTYEKALTSGDGTRIGMVMTLPRGFHGVAAMDAWERSKEPIGVFPFDAEGAIDYVHKMVTTGRFDQIDPNPPTDDDIRHIGGITFVMARTTHGEIGYSLPGEVPHPPPADLETLTRFAAVFDLAYRRFEDLRQAEAQAREAQIEAALERVRSRAMGMQKPEDVRGVIEYLYAELKGLDATLFEESDWIRLPEAMKAFLREQPSAVSTEAIHRRCFLDAVAKESVSVRATVLLERFVRIVDLAMTRHADLQAAEAAAREARIEASMERVRARAMAMMEPEELDDVVNLLRDEFGRLELEDLETASLFLREGDASARCWFCIAAVDGRISDDILIEFERTAVSRAIGAFFGGSDPRVSIPMTGAARREWIEYCYALSTKLSGFYGGEIPDRTYHLRRFSSGAIAAATPGDLSDESWDVLRRGAGVFELAYSRFQDLQRAREDLRLLKEEKALTERTLAELRATQAQLVQQEKLASLGSLTAGIAHEIKNPLNFVNNFAEVNAELAEEARDALASGDLDGARQALADLEENATQIAKHGKRADSIVRAMMQHARGGASEKETVDVNAFLDEYAALAWHGMRARDASFQAEVLRDFDPDAGTIRAMPQDLGRVVLNLLGNAFDALKGVSGPQVTLTSHRMDAGVEITVSDNGPGIPPAIRDKIFEPFFTTKPTGEGTGLGLSLSYDIVTKGHAGMMTVEERPGGGARFVLALPA